MASGMSESTRQRVDDILTASKMELELEAEAELNARLKEMEKRAEGIAGVIERAADRDRMGRQLSDDEGGYVDASAPAVREDILEVRSRNGAVVCLRSSFECAMTTPLRGLSLFRLDVSLEG